MARQTHYEIAVRDRPRGPWRLAEIVAERYAALKRAEALLADGPFAAVQVTREVFDEGRGDYTGLKIFEAEAARAASGAPAEDMAALPCLEPADLYSAHARDLIARVLSDTLNRWTITAYELIHRADALQRLEATGTLYMHGLQKVAVAHAPRTGRPVAQIVKALNALCLTAMHKVYRDERENRFPVVAAEGFAALAEAEAGRARAPYVIGGALAKYLAPVRTWDDKLARLMALAPSVPPAGPARALLIAAIDAVAAELAAGPALSRWMQADMPLGPTLVGWIGLAHGRAPPGAAAGAVALARGITTLGLPETRRALARRIVAEMTGPRRLDPDSILGEIRMLRRLGLALAELGGGLVADADVVAAFDSRSRRLVSGDAVGELIAGASDPMARLARLLDLEENIVGADNKRKLAAYLVPILGSHQTERHLMAAAAAPMATLQRLAALQARVRWSGFAAPDKVMLEQGFDALAWRLAAAGTVMEAFAPAGLPPVVRACGLLQLFAANAVTEGAFAQALRQEIAAALSDPRAIRRYVADLGPETQTALAELRALLEDAGLDPEMLAASLSAA